jgi:DNA binding domain, excisionase family
MPRELYQTVKEVGDRLEVSEATVRGWIKVGALRAIDIGKGWRIADRDLEDFLTRRETRARFAVARPFGCPHHARRDRTRAKDPSRDLARSAPERNRSK